MRIRARHYATAEKIDLTIESDRIANVSPAGNDAVDLDAGWVAPALFDLQINGCNGHSFNSPNLNLEQVRGVVDVCRGHGIGGLLPTLVTNSFEAILHGFKTLDRARASDAVVARAVPGYHLEGPYISPEDGPRGAHPRAHVRAPDWDEFCRWQDAARGSIRLVTLAPEHDHAIRFIERAVQAGVAVAIGHTAAAPERIRAAILAGARLSTHLGNGSHAVLPRHENYLWEQLASDDLWASVIPDGHHLPAAVVKCITRVKTPSRTIITCDASSLAGLPPGKYTQWGSELEVLPNGKIVVPGTPYLAGSGSFTDDCIGKMVEMAGIPLSAAIDMASSRPRELLGLPVQRLEEGEPARVVLFDWQPGGEFGVKAVTF